MAYEVTEVDAPAMKLLGVARRASLAKLSEVLMPAFDTVYAHLDRASVTQRGHNVILYTAVRTNAGAMEFDFVAGVEVGRDVPASDEVRLHETPSGPAAMTTHWGEYAGLHAAHEAIHAWCAANARRSGRNWEVYGDWSDDPAQVRTDVYYELLP